MSAGPTRTSPPPSPHRVVVESGLATSRTLGTRSSRSRPPKDRAGGRARRRECSTIQGDDTARRRRLRRGFEPSCHPGCRSKGLDPPPRRRARAPFRGGDRTGARDHELFAPHSRCAGDSMEAAGVAAAVRRAAATPCMSPAAPSRLVPRRWLPPGAPLPQARRRTVRRSERGRPLTFGVAPRRAARVGGSSPRRSARSSVAERRQRSRTLQGSRPTRVGHANPDADDRPPSTPPRGLYVGSAVVVAVFVMPAS